jgi:type VI secretion system protein ImpG
MHPRLLELYNRELRHVREMGAEFAHQFPKIASRLTLDGVEVADPYVERLLEGFAFLAARVQLKIEAEFPRFVQQLLEVTYPALTAPVPSMAIACLRPDPAEPKLAAGVTVDRGATLRSTVLRGADTRCQFTTAHAVTLWPLQIEAVQYFTYAADLPLVHLPPEAARAKGGLRIRLRTLNDLPLSQIGVDRLPFFISAPDETAYRLYELVLGAPLGAIVQPAQRPAPHFDWLGPRSVGAVGFDDSEALMPPSRAGFRGYRLLQEYAAMPQRFLFFEVSGLAAAFGRAKGQELEIVLLFSRGDTGLEALIDQRSLALYCTPAVNLFRRRLDRIQVAEGQWEYHAVVDRTRPIDYEVFRIERVTGFGPAQAGEQLFLPLFAHLHHEGSDHGAYFTTRREPRLISPSRLAEGPRSSYRGSEVYLTLVDPSDAPYRGDLRQLSVEALVTNRDLPLLLPAGGAEARDRDDFVLESSAPVAGVRCLRGPTRPALYPDHGVQAWRMVSHLNLNYLSLLDCDEREGAAALRALLQLYGPIGDEAFRRQIDGVRHCRVRRVVRRLPFDGPLTFGSGAQIELACDELAFQGASAFLLTAVLEHLFARHAGINNFTETALRSESRGLVMQWPPRIGTRPIL